jgi:FtsZ-interacting cell division protein ZipA
MNIYEVIGLVAAVVTILGFMWSIKKDLASKFDKLDTDMRIQSKRTDQQLCSQSARTDKLYEMFVDLVTKMK